MKLHAGPAAHGWLPARRQNRIRHFVVALLFLTAWTVQAQEATPESGAPLLTGYTGFVTTLQPGEQTLVPNFNPILLLPFGKRWLVEGEGEFVGEFQHRDDSGEWERSFERDIEYAQLDFVANRHLTVVAGRFLSPFGIYNERLHPTWIKKLQPAPLIFALEAGSGNGGMLRGGSRLGSGLNLSYSGYFSAGSTVSHLESTRSAGGRLGFFLPRLRAEVGGSVQRQFQDDRMKLYGFDVSWQPAFTPLEVRSEYARSGSGSGYWLEGAYRLLRKHEVVARVEQFFVPDQPLAKEMAEGEEEGEHGALPETNAQRLLVGWNYYVNDGLKFSFAYGRQFSAEGDRNIFSLGFAYRLLFPLLPGDHGHSLADPAPSRPRPVEEANHSPAEGGGSENPAQVSGPARRTHFGVDPAFAYQVNCARCHVEPRRVADRELVTVIRHMRVRANLTSDESEAILYFLAK